MLCNLCKLCRFAACELGVLRSKAVSVVVEAVSMEDAQCGGIGQCSQLMLMLRRVSVLKQEAGRVWWRKHKRAVGRTSSKYKITSA